MRTAGQSRRANAIRRVCGALVVGMAMLIAAPAIAQAPDLPRGAVIGDIECQDSPAQHYSLYLPSNFTPERSWPVILLFDPGANGRQGVERYQAAAERYGYILAGSNSSRNGPWEIGLTAANAMSRDLKQRFPVDNRRVYTAGMSGGARVAIMVAQLSDSIAGVFASGAAYADAFHESARFPLFGSVGSEDFNYREMHALDLRMKTPHRVEVFDGGHTWLPSELATDGVAWMELQAMKTGLRPRDDTFIDESFTRRRADAEARPTALARMRALKLVAADFEGFKDVTAIADNAADLERRTDVADALRSEREDDRYERQLSDEFNRLLRQLGWPERQRDAFEILKAHVGTLFATAAAPTDTADRRIARRTLASLRASARGIPHPEFKALMQATPTP